MQPFVFQHNSLKHYFPLKDLSLGGFGVETSFPYYNSIWKGDFVDEKAKLWLSGQNPINLPLELRWQRKITIEKSSKVEFPHIKYLFGFMFKTEEEQLPKT